MLFDKLLKSNNEKMKSPLRSLSVEGKLAVTSDFIKPSLVICNIFVTTPAIFYLETIKSARNEGFVS